ncbi:MAG: sensor histidine kinase [Arenicellales bacterium]
MKLNAGSLAGLDRKQLQRWLLLFFLALAIPAGILVYQAYSQLKWEAFYVHRVQAEELVKRIDKQFRQLIDNEEARSFTDYNFLNVLGDPSASILQRSPLAAFPVKTTIPGVIGYFQVDTNGTFSTPLLPESGTQTGNYGISPDQLKQRQSLQNTLRQILSSNRLVQSYRPSPAAAPAVSSVGESKSASRTDSRDTVSIADEDDSEQFSSGKLSSSSGSTSLQNVPGQAAFDQLQKQPKGRDKKQKAAKLGRLEDLNLDYSFQQTIPPAKDRQLEEEELSEVASVTEKRARKERNVLPEPDKATVSRTPAYSNSEPLTIEKLPIHTFESEIDPLEFSLLDSGHFVLYRKVWRDGQRYIQGMLIEQQGFLQNIIQTAFLETSLSDMSKLIVVYQGNVFTAFGGVTSGRYLSSAEELEGAVLYQTRLSDPLGELELIFSVTRLPVGPGGAVIGWLAMILVLILCSGFYLMYRLGIKQIELARQQQDFVSAVSHELKTPLTSIRMYGEMLREGWAPNEKKQAYYEFIHDESERLSRLINNVLQLARMTRNDLQLDLKTVAVSELMDGIRSRVASQVERAGFKLQINCQDQAAAATIEVDSDGFTQIIINLVDNAIKFSINAEQKTIDLHCRLLSDGSIQFSVRDYGSGIEKSQIKKIFRLFYRSGNELTRETVGTGIGLALVYQLATEMGGTVDVVNRDPGAEFLLSLKAQ